MTDHRYGDAPLGKSVEEIDNESGNRVNSPVEGEVRREQQDQDGLVPIAIPGNAGGGAMPAVGVPQGGLVERGAGADDGRSTTSRDSTEE